MRNKKLKGSQVEERVFVSGIQIQLLCFDSLPFRPAESLHPGSCYDPTMMLLMGMWMSLTKNPMKPIIAKPMAVAIAIFWNSEKS